MCRRSPAPALRLLGTAGGAMVAAMATLDSAENPALLAASTRYAYVVPICRPESVKLVAFTAVVVTTAQAPPPVCR